MAAIRIERPDRPEVIALIDELDAYQQVLYPPESHHGIDIAALLSPEVIFAVARDAAGQAVGCGAVVRHGESGELKRMFVRPALRGAGIARALLAFLEAEALAARCHALRLETGIHQHEAIGLYTRCGYAPRGPFAGYIDDPMSLFMEKRLA